MTGRLDGVGRIDRTRPIRFRFAGRAHQGFAGDTLASALLASGVVLLARSFKLHRPRGLMAAGPEEPNALVDVLAPGDRRPNVKATEVELCDGLAAVPVNCWPSLAFDVGAANALIGRFIPVGFYYKTFFWPSWRFYEPFIRRAAGFGRPGDAPARARFEHRFAHCDVLVVGGGRAGLAAAAEAAAAGARVILCDQDFELGGRLLWNGRAVDGRDGPGWARDMAARIAAAPGARVLARTAATGIYDHGAVGLAERLAGGGLRLWQVRAGRLVIATGRTQRPLVFPGNDRPGVMLADAALCYQVRFGVRLAERAVVVGSDDSAYETARALAAAGVRTALADLRPTPGIPAPAGVEWIAGAEIVRTHGARRLAAVSLRDAAGAVRRIDCELLAMSGGWTPNLQLFGQAGGAVAYEAGALRLGDRPSGVAVVGSASAAETPASPPPRAPGKAFVDVQADVTAADIALAAREGFVSVEHLKRYTALGMGTDQGRIGARTGQALLGALTARAPDAVGAPRARPPVTPVPIAAFAGRARGELFAPRRQSPLHALHQQLGGALEDYGGWLRPACYPNAGESCEADAVRREALAVRQGVGLFDASPLGKIEVVGPDAAWFLSRIYANQMAGLPVGRARYGLMLNELGVIIDDGVTLRLAEDRFLVGTSSAGAERMALWLDEWRQCEWPERQVLVAPMTTAVGVVTVSGPRARAALQAAGTDIDLAPDAFPHMAFREGRVAGVEARLVSASFSGERSYEVNVPAGRAESVWRAIAAVAPDAVPVGVEAWLLLRLEKGFLHVGVDTDGATTPDDVGFGHVARRRGWFVGKRSLSRPENRRDDRHQLVGVEALDGARLEPGAHLLRPGGAASEGYVTSAGVSPTLGRTAAMAMVRNGRARLGEILVLANAPARRLRIAPRCAYDPDGGRMGG